MHRVKALALCALLASSGIGNAQSLRVSPVTIDLPPLAKSAILTIGNDSEQPVQVQARVFRWSQINGEDQLKETSDVVVSPPLFTVRRGQGSIVRVVRIGASPVTSEETYRVLIDEIPDRKRLQTGAVNLVMRQSIPVFFNAMDVQRGAVSWSTSTRKGKLVLEATNPGQKRVKLSQLRVTDGTARELLSLRGLAGYVLAGQAKVWELSLPRSGLNAGTLLKINADSDGGPVSASTVLGKRG